MLTQEVAAVDGLPFTRTWLQNVHVIGHVESKEAFEQFRTMGARFLQLPITEVERVAVADLERMAA